MFRLRCRVKISENLCSCIIEGNNIDFTRSEFEDLIRQIRREGLYSYLQRERPALISSLHAILSRAENQRELYLEEEEKEFVLEQAFLDMADQLPV